MRQSSNEDVRLEQEIQKTKREKKRGKRKCQKQYRDKIHEKQFKIRCGCTCRCSIWNTQTKSIVNRSSIQYNWCHEYNRLRTEGTYVGRLDSGFGMHLIISPRVKVISPVSPDETSKKSHRHSAISPIGAVYDGGNSAWNPFFRRIGAGAGAGAVRGAGASARSVVEVGVSVGVTGSSERGIVALVPFVTTFKNQKRISDDDD